jgi:hypothetical protein
VAGITAVFFDLGDTLGTAIVGGHPPRLTGFDVFPFAPGLLTERQARGLRRGVRGFHLRRGSFRGVEWTKASSLLPRLEPFLCGDSRPHTLRSLVVNPPDLGNRG